MVDLKKKSVEGKKNVKGGKKGKGKRGKYLLVGIVLVLIVLVGVIIYILISRYGGGFYGPVEGECRVIRENVGKNKVDIVFLTNNVSGSEVENYVDYFLKSEPFVGNEEKFNFYYAGEGNCEIVQEKAVYCYSKELLRKSSVCPNDFIVVLSDKPKQIRSSGYMNVMSVNIHHSKNVILHEFAHVFANIADEYVPSIIPWGAENCQGKCEGFEEFGDLEGCYQGCSEVEYFRSSENSVMRVTSTNDYGKLNTIILKENIGEYE